VPERELPFTNASAESAAVYYDLRHHFDQYSKSKNTLFLHGVRNHETLAASRDSSSSAWDRRDARAAHSTLWIEGSGVVGVLMALYAHSGGVAHPSDLSAITAQGAANISRINDVLMNRGLITRVLSVKDRRRMVLGITQQGEELVRALLPRMYVPVQEMMLELPESDQRQMIEQLKHLGRILDGPEGAPGR
jgi:DNA-binding MarR family transcriptional regulator